MLKQKSQPITKRQVWEAYKKVKANRGSAGVDWVSLEDYELKLKDNLYKLWNRMASGSYYPPPVLEVEIPKKDGRTRKLGIPTVGDRIAQMVVKEALEPKVEPLFHRNSCGYRPGKSAHEAIEKARRQCWRCDWVIDLDIKGLFDNLDHKMLMRAVEKHTKEKWVLMYIERWLKAPVEKEGGRREERTKGTPQGGVISPLLANIFLHHAFDKWMEKEFSAVEFERYADDIIVHCKSLTQATHVLNKIRERLEKCGLELNAEKTKIVYCKDSNRKAEFKYTEFTFLGYTFRARPTRSPKGRRFKSFSPAVSKGALKKMAREIRRLKIHRRTEMSIEEIAKMLNPKLRGWIYYYGKFRLVCLKHFLHRLNVRLLKWIRNKYKALRYRVRAAKSWLKNVYKNNPELFAHWRFGVRP
ncbi:MAG: group II intron reverse transcriptase/maturase [Desulfatiglandales bacterium]